MLHCFKFLLFSTSLFFGFSQLHVFDAQNDDTGGDNEASEHFQEFVEESVAFPRVEEQDAANDGDAGGEVICGGLSEKELNTRKA